MDASITIPGYRILRVAGRGGMGVVYEAERDDGTHAAVKVIAPEHRESDEFATRFAREATLALQLRHPHLVRLIESGVSDDGQPFLAFAYIDGTDLDKHLRERKQLRPAETAQIISQVAGALDAAHELGFVHRDVKPANVLLNRTGAAFLNDFGLTRPVSGTRFTVSGMWLGTVDYAAPEQIQGQAVDARTDIYALAAMAYHLLGGAVPFPRDSDMAKLWAHVNDARPNLPANIDHRAVLDRVIARGMAKDPEVRFLSAGDFAQALAGASNGQTPQLDERMVATGAAAPSRAITVPLPTAGGTLPQPAPTAPLPVARSRRRVVVGAVVALVLAGAGATTALVLGQPDQPGAALQRGTAAPADQDVDVDVYETNTATPEPTATATATPEATATARPRPRPRSAASPRRNNDLPLALDIESNIPTQVGSWSPYDDATPGAAQQAFGDEYEIAPDSDTTACTFEWRTIGISVTFVNFGNGNACDVDDGLAQTIRIDGAATKRWRTLSGLRPGMSESAIAKLYPKARKTDSGEWWLVTAKSPIGDGGYYAPLAVTIDEDGDVSGFDLWVGAGGD